jgi:DNA repair exonuclease SbcCD ATPase subunit
MTESSLDNGSTAPPENVETPDEGQAICRLDGCATRIPANRKGGKKYCSKAHADQASRQRRQLAETTAGPVLDELRALRQEAEATFSEHGAPLLAAISALQERFTTLDSSAVAETALAREEAASAKLAQQEAQDAAEQDRSRARDAERRALDDRERRAEAERDADRAREAAREAEIARAKADGARQSAVEAKGTAEERAALVASELADLRSEHSQLQTRLHLLDEQLATDRRRHEDTVRELREQHQAELRTRQDHHQDLLRRLESDRDDTRTRLAEERHARTELRDELDQLRGQRDIERNEVSRKHAGELNALHERIAELSGDLGAARERSTSASTTLTGWRSALTEILEHPAESVPDRLRALLHQGDGSR